MKWGAYKLLWGRPLKSILSVFDRKIINFQFHHLNSSNSTYIDKAFEDKKKIFTDFKAYEKYFKNQNSIVNQNQRKELINREFKKILDKSQDLEFVSMNIDNVMVTDNKINKSKLLILSIFVSFIISIGLILFIPNKN